MVVYKKNDLLKDLEKVSKKFFKKFPSHKNVTRDYYRQNGKFKDSLITKFFGSFKNFTRNVQNTAEISFTRENIDIEKKFKNIKKKIYFVTGLITGAPISENFYESIQKYCKTKNAELILLCMRGYKKKDSFSKEEYERFKPYLATNYTFNSNLKAIDFELEPQQIKSLTGLLKYGSKKFSLLVAHTKQFMTVVPSDIGNLPHIVHSTGTISKPMYNKTRRGAIANQDHTYGGLIVEVKDDKIFNIRQVQADKKGGFNDINKYYYKDTVTTSIPECFVMGDCHYPFEDSLVMKSWKEIIKETKVKNVVFHDIIDYKGITHHNKNDLRILANLEPCCRTIETTLDTTAKRLIKWLKDIRKGRKFYVVKSNHEGHLDKYLTEGRFIKDKVNLKLTAELYYKFINDKDINITEYYLKGRYPELSILNFLTRKSSLRFANIQVASHGDKGNNGGRGGVKSFTLRYGNNVTAHSHSPQIENNSWRVGTSSLYDLGYNSEGSGSSWLHTSGLIFPNGNRQLITSINGEWKI
jgi:hypothetical protein